MAAAMRARRSAASRQWFVFFNPAPALSPIWAYDQNNRGSYGGYFHPRDGSPSSRPYIRLLYFNAILTAPSAPAPAGAAPTSGFATKTTGTPLVPAALVDT